MAELFASISDFKAHVGGAINQTVDLNSLAPVIADTARRHLTPYLSQAFYDLVVTASETVSPSSEMVALLPFVRRPLALLTMHEYARIGGLEFGESGIYRIETDSRKSAYRYQEKEYGLYMLEKGYEALELLLKFLYNNVSDYPEWADTDEAEMHLSTLLNYASDVRRLLNVQCDRYTFETLRPIILEVQHFGVERLLPTAFWDDFYAGHLIDDLSTPEQTLRTYMRAAIAHRTYQEAMRRMVIRVANGRIYVMEEYGEQSQVNKTLAQGNITGQHMLAHDVWADRHTAKWKDYITSHAEDFPLVFDVASGGTNTNADAWHINTADEQTIADQVDVTRLNAPIFQM